MKTKYVNVSVTPTGKRFVVNLDGKYSWNGRPVRLLDVDYLGSPVTAEYHAQVAYSQYLWDAMRDNIGSEEVHQAQEEYREINYSIPRLARDEFHRFAERLFRRYGD